MSIQSLLTNTMDLMQYLENNRTYVVASYAGRFIFPLGHKVETILTIQTNEDIGMCSPRVTSQGISVRYSTQELVGMTFLIHTRVELFNNYTDCKIIKDNLRNIIVERYHTHNSERYKELHSRVELEMSPALLFGLLMIEQVRELVKPVLSDKEDGGELLLYAYDKQDCRRIYKVVNSNTHEAIMFYFINDFNIKLLKNLGSITHSSITINKDLNNETTIVHSAKNQRLENIASYNKEILEQAKEVYKLDNL